MSIAVTTNDVQGLAHIDGHRQLTAAVVSGPTNGALALAADGSFTYTPNAGFGGTDSFGNYIE